MRVLWITNTLFEEYYASKGLPGVFTGGWMRSLALKLKELDPTIELAIASRDRSANGLEEVQAGGFVFYALPGVVYQDGYDALIEKYWKEVAERFKPEIVHIHGSEFPHGLAYVKNVGKNRCVVSLQGIISRIARYYAGGISPKVFSRHRTFYDTFVASTPAREQKKYERQGRLEEELLQTVSHIIGRTSWDKDHAWAINPNAEYHFCNETLRAPFYNTEKWTIGNCKRHHIFLSQAAKPIKGIHRLIEAMPLILREYPDTEVYVAGVDFLSRSTLRDKLRRTTYASYIGALIDKYSLQDKIHFTGMINAEKMAEQYRMANVFVCPSAIENSPNSLGEAQLMGCPVVASYVGGVPDMVEHGVTGLMYRFEETEMLASAVCRIFGDDDLCSRLSRNEIAAASVRHDGDVNARRMLDIYKKIAAEE